MSDPAALAVAGRTGASVVLPELVAFDLDDTLAPSKGRLPDPMADALHALLARTDVAVISGGRFAQFEAQVVRPLEALGASRFGHLHLMPTCGTQYFRFDDGEWTRRYVELLSDDERARAFRLIESAARELGLWEEDTWGPVLEDRETQVTFSGLGQSAPIEAKAAWDPDGRKKRALRAAGAALLPDLEIRVGGTTSIDVTRPGRDKAYGMRRLSEAMDVGLDRMLFIGDQLGIGGNDHPVLVLGVACHDVRGWHDTRSLIETMLLS